MSNSVLIVTVGLPRSGKSTWSIMQECPVVNPDSIRLALHGRRFEALAEPFVWAIAKVMVRALFLAGHIRVILDATNTTRKRRDEWRSEDWVTYFKVFTTPRTACLERAGSDEELKAVIESMALRAEPLADDEPVWTGSKP
jgi:predicted kinase